MKKNHRKTLLTIAGSALLCSATWLAAPSKTAAFVTVKGQDKAGKRCERIDSRERSVFGRCEKVCKDREVVRDASNNRWVCNRGGRVVKNL